MSDREKPNPNCRYGRWDCTPCINCDAYIPTMTNADHIRAMTDEELAKFLNRHAHDPWTSPSGGWSDWLHQPCEDSPTVEKG